MKESLTLAELQEGESLKVTKIEEKDEEEFKRRCMDLGIVEGAAIDCIGKSPLGDPKAYRVRGTVLALRKKESEKIWGSWIEKKDSRKDQTEKEKKDRVIGVAGNPNVGKSTLFNKLTGLKQHTGNWPGKTVAKACGSCSCLGRSYQLVDLPGCYSLFAQSPEEKIARDYICSQEADAVLVICDGTCLERNLNLVLQVQRLTSRVVVCVNLMDEVARKHMKVDLAYLERELGVPVLGITARGRILKEEIFEKLEEVIEREKSRIQEVGVLELGDEEGRKRLVRAEELAERAVIYEKKEYDRKDRRLDWLFTSRVTGFPIMLLLLFFIFWLTIAGANYPSQLLSRFFSWAEEGLFVWFVRLRMPQPLVEILLSGVFRVTGWVVAVMLPPMAIFFPLFTLLEDYGYLPRIAFNLDRCFQCCHACGRQALTMCMGFGCNAAGVTGCRIISSERERLIAVLTNSFVPCNGRFPTLIALISMFIVAGGSKGIGPAAVLAGVVLLGVGLTFFVSWLLGKTILKGMSSTLTLELPPYRRPKPGMILFRSFVDRTFFILLRAVKAAVPAGLFIWLLANTNVGAGGESLLSVCAGVLEPAARWLGMDGVILLAFILGFPANEIVVPIILMAYLSGDSLIEFGSLTQLKEILAAHGWTIKTAVCTMLFTLCHWPCATTCMTIKKETNSRKWTWVAFWLPTGTGILLCIVTAAIFSCFGL